MDFFLENSDLDAKRLETNRQVSHETTNFTARYQRGKQRNKSRQSAAQPNTVGAFHLVKIFGSLGSVENGNVSSARPTGKLPEKVENLKRLAFFPGWNFPNENCWCS